MAENHQRAAADRARELIQLHRNDPETLMEALDELLCDVLTKEGYDDLLTVLDGAGLDS